MENLGAYGIEILKAANRFNMTHLKTLCGEFFVEHLADDNVIALVKIANDCNADFLKNHCVYFIVKHMIHAKEKKIWNDSIPLDTFIDNHSNILYDILNVLSTLCEVRY